MLSPEQLVERRRYIGGSDVGAICGFNRYRTPLDVYKEKIGEQEPEILTNSFIEWGNFLEDPLRKKFTEITALIVKEKDTKRHSKYDFLAANIDGYTSNGQILEIKCVGLNARKSWDDNLIPPSYLCQCAHYAYIYDVEKVYIAAFFGIDRPLDVRIYERNQRFEHQIMTKCIDFWQNNVLKSFAPMPTTYEEIKTLLGDSRPETTKIASNEIYEISHQLESEKEKIKTSKKYVEEKSLQIMEFMGDAELLYDIGGEKLNTFKTSLSTRIDPKKLRELHPKIATECSYTTKTRPLK